MTKAQRRLSLVADRLAPVAAARRFSPGKPPARSASIASATKYWKKQNFMLQAFPWQNPSRRARAGDAMEEGAAATWRGEPQIEDFFIPNGCNPLKSPDSEK
jgi:hypothetical protein